MVSVNYSQILLLFLLALELLLRSHCSGVSDPDAHSRQADLLPNIHERYADFEIPINRVVGPPQTVNGIACTEASNPPPNYITIEFDGAAGASYSLNVPLGGGSIPTSKTISLL
jgi:hypothetical protein